MIIKTRAWVLSVFMLSACSEPTLPDREKPLASNDTITRTKQESISTNEVYNDGGPPFSDTCLCSFDMIAEIRSGNKLDLLISGKNWNPDFYSCSWTWGEYIANEFPGDSTIKEFSIHLVDMDKQKEVLDSRFLLTKTFNDHLIASYSKVPGETYMSCKFDPNKTGKYPKPQQWTE